VVGEKLALPPDASGIELIRVRLASPRRSKVHKRHASSQ
jgi:hypothetical protein